MDENSLLSSNKLDIAQETPLSTLTPSDLNVSINNENSSDTQNRIENSNPDLIDENNENVQVEVENKKLLNNNKKQSKETSEELNFITKPCQLALSRIKTIMKLDPELNLASKDSVFLVAKATELFVDFISKEAYKYTSQGTRKTMQRKDIDQAVNSVDSLCFLDAALD